MCSVHREHARLYAETIAAPRVEQSKERQDIAVASPALPSGVLSKRQLASAMATWTIHGRVPLIDHWRTLNLVDDAQQAQLAQCAGIVYLRRGEHWQFQIAVRRRHQYTFPPPPLQSI